MLYILNLILCIYLCVKSKQHQSFLYKFRHLESAVENSITLVINGPGQRIQILNNDNLPNKIYINDSPAEVSKTVNLIKEGTNIIKMKWNNKLTNARYMFENCRSFISADLSNFDASSIGDMTGIFVNCISLEFVNLTNFNCPNTVTFYRAFEGCTSLTSIDTTNINIPKLNSFRNTFYYCTSLLTLNISNINYYDFYYIERMFSESSLMLLDITNLDTSGSGVTGDEFTNCNKLKYINLKNYKGKDIFSSIPNNNIIICMKNYDQLSNSHSLKQKGAINDCSNPCFQSPKIINFNEEKCYYDCPKLKDGEFCNYERSEVLSEMPDGFFLNDTYEKTIDKCFPVCKTCVNYGDENDNNCTECILGYYPKINDTFLNCYNEPNGYFLDNNIYKPCYSTCNHCFGFGDENNHSCIDCISGYEFINNAYYNYNCYEKCQYYIFNINLNKYECSEGYSLFIDLLNKTKNEIFENYNHR